jgi:hypothetical protein
MGVLEWSLGHTNRDEVLRSFIGRGAYDLINETERGTTQLDGWSGVRAGTRIVLSTVFEQSRTKAEYMCPRPQCREWNDCNEADDGWIDW